MYKKLLPALLIALNIGATAQSPKSAFTIVPLGIKGGIDESNLSAYMVASANSTNYICLDAGTLNYGIEKAVKKGIFKVSSEQVLCQYIKGYFISHAHLDHISGLIINSPDDSTKSIYGLAPTLETIKTHYFTWASWANFTNDGEKPLLNKYSYKSLEPGKEVKIDNTEMTVKAFPLSHSNLTSTAFLIKSGDNYLLYLGDVGADTIEKTQNLRNLWQAIAPLIKTKQLKGIMIEVSYPNSQPEKSLFGHLTPKLLMDELTVLGGYADMENLKGFNIVVTHVKPPEENIKKLKEELKSENSLGVNLIFPKQGKKLEL
ncbi:3',5'-cyclic-nucleotide phosphodiesterase [Mucilaginibacter limnophilus]|uniref:3',5'-cyclic-nucleotide phosphodiesterase n=1 Tax=Mucilaginibacter limnophilus TaxID=1932778 RepID=A0A437MQN1_9SPHI|nr:3',5'-cyclic-nucleotide phosphodiesterase [Mucilaginibacter limnophilus]